MEKDNQEKDLLTQEQLKEEYKKVEEQKKEYQKEELNSATPYDDVFRTMLVDQSKLVIPIINEIFHENYTGEEDVIFTPNEHFIDSQESQEKRVTDSSFSIIGKGNVAKKYLFECQSNSDSSMLVRIFEYSTQIALDESELLGNQLKVEIPNCAILFLRSNSNTPDKMQIDITTPGGSVSYDVLVMKAQQYSIEDIFEKKLLFLIPFYIFTYDKQLEEYNKNSDKLRQLKQEYIKIKNQLDELYNKRELKAFTYHTILKMSEKVVDSLAVKYVNVRKGVREIMGGRVLEYEAKTIYNQGVETGRREGEIAGRREGEIAGRREGEIAGRREGEIAGKAEGIKLTKLVLKLEAQGYAISDIATEAQISVEEVKKILEDD